MKDCRSPKTARPITIPATSLFAVFMTAALLASISFSGCGGSRLGTVPVKGKVTINGQPVKKGTVFFQPVDAAKGRPARSGIKPDGSYAASSLDNDQAIGPGEYKVLLMPPAMEVGSPAGKASIPQKYRDANTSGLTITVPYGGGPITYDIEMSN